MTISSKAIDVPGTDLTITRRETSAIVIRRSHGQRHVLRHVQWDGKSIRPFPLQITGLTNDEISRCERALRGAK